MFKHLSDLASDRRRAAPKQLRKSVQKDVMKVHQRLWQKQGAKQKQRYGALAKAMAAKHRQELMAQMGSVAQQLSDARQEVQAEAAARAPGAPPDVQRPLGGCRVGRLGRAGEVCRLCLALAENPAKQSLPSACSHVRLATAGFGQSARAFEA